MMHIRDDRHTLVLRWSTAGPVVWARVSVAGRVLEVGEDEPATLLARYRPDAHRLCVLLPAVMATVHAVPQADKARRQLSRAAPFLLEESLADDLETQHVALLSDSDPPRAAAIDRDSLDECLQVIREADWEAESLFPEHWVWAQQQTGPALAVSGDRVWYAEDDAPVSLPLPLFAAWLEEQDPEALPSAINVAVSEEADRRTLENTLPGGVAERLHWTAPVSWERLATAAAALCQPGLAQQRYTPRAQWRHTFRRWRGLIAAVLVLAVGHTGALAWQQARLDRQWQQADEALLALFHEIRPEGRAVNPQVQLHQRLREVRQAGPSRFMGLLYPLARRVHEQSGATLRDVQYDATQGWLQVNIEAGDMPTLQAVLADRSDGIQLRMNSSTTRDDRVLASLRVEGAAP